MRLLCLGLTCLAAVLISVFRLESKQFPLFEGLDFLIEFIKARKCVWIVKLLSVLIIFFWRFFNRDEKLRPFLGAEVRFYESWMRRFQGVLFDL
jgi:hypothetical protein